MELIQIKNNIEKMSKNHQLEIFKIINNNNIDYNENKNGIFINLTSLEKKILKEIEEYIKIVSKQNIYLNEQEEIKENYLNSYFKNNKDNDTKQNDKEQEPEQNKQYLPSYAI
mgnify:CR=1 FL=1